jgi:hypothetical protein
MNYLKSGLLTAAFAVITLSGNSSSIGEGVESQISGKNASVENTDRNSTSSSTNSTTRSSTSSNTSKTSATVARTSSANGSATTTTTTSFPLDLDF